MAQAFALYLQKDHPGRVALLKTLHDKSRTWTNVGVAGGAFAGLSSVERVSQARKSGRMMKLHSTKVRYGWWSKSVTQHQLTFDPSNSNHVQQVKNLLMYDILKQGGGPRTALLVTGFRVGAKFVGSVVVAGGMDAVLQEIPSSVVKSSAEESISQ